MRADWLENSELIQYHGMIVHQPPGETLQPLRQDLVHSWRIIAILLGIRRGRILIHAYWRHGGIVHHSRMSLAVSAPLKQTRH